MVESNIWNQTKDLNGLGDPNVSVNLGINISQNSCTLHLDHFRIFFTPAGSWDYDTFGILNLEAANERDDDVCI